jgi:hypothetical protein
MSDVTKDPLYAILEEAIDVALVLWDDPAFAAAWQQERGGSNGWSDLPDLLGVPRGELPDTQRGRLAELAIQAAAEIRARTSNSWN